MQSMSLIPKREKLEETMTDDEASKVIQTLTECKDALLVLTENNKLFHALEVLNKVR